MQNNFLENQHFKKCEHSPLSEDDRTKPWLTETSQSYKKIVAAIRGPGDCRLKDLELLTEFQHTGTGSNANQT